MVIFEMIACLHGVHRDLSSLEVWRQMANYYRRSELLVFFLPGLLAFFFADRLVKMSNMTYMFEHVMKHAMTCSHMTWNIRSGYEDLHA